MASKSINSTTMDHIIEQISNLTIDWKAEISAFERFKDTTGGVVRIFIADKETPVNPFKRAIKKSMSHTPKTKWVITELSGANKGIRFLDEFIRLIEEELDIQASSETTIPNITVGANNTANGDIILSNIDINLHRQRPTKARINKVIETLSLRQRDIRLAIILSDIRQSNSHEISNFCDLFWTPLRKEIYNNKPLLILVSDSHHDFLPTENLLIEISNSYSMEALEHASDDIAQCLLSLNFYNTIEDAKLMSCGIVTGKTPKTLHINLANTFLRAKELHDRISTPR